jgi:hypothetical protein
MSFSKTSASKKPVRRCSTDVGIIRVRHRLLEAALGLRDRGKEPPGVAEPATYRRRGCQMVLPRDADWLGASEAEQRC